MWHFILGIGYTLINGLVRKIEVEDWSLPFVWILLPELGILCLGIDYFNKKITKIRLG